MNATLGKWGNYKMTIETNLHGRVRNTKLPFSNGLLPLFEAVANSIHAIEEANLPTHEQQITVEIIREGQATMDFNQKHKRPGPEAKSEIKAFIVTDNGIGFNDSNMKSFQTLDTDYKVEKGGRGVGRLLWLKAFNNVKIESVYKLENGQQKKRTFSFNVKEGVTEPIVIDTNNSPQGSVVLLDQFEKRYRDTSPKTASIIARDLLEHCLWYFIRPDAVAPSIKVVDDGEVIPLADIFNEQMLADTSQESFTLKDYKFDLIHVKLSPSSTRVHSVGFCAANRVVTRESIKGKLPGLYGDLHDKETGYFVYEAYVSSPLLDELVRPERTGFDIDKEPLPLLSSNELSQKEIS